MNTLALLAHVCALGPLLTVSGAYLGGTDQLSVEVKDPQVKNVNYEPETAIYPKRASNETVDLFILELHEGEEVPEENDTEPRPQGRISYVGSQLWKVYLDSNEKQMILIELRNSKDLKTWGGNSTSIDVLIKPASLETVSNKLRANNINYDITIQDLQQAIEDENPQLSEEEQELQDRKGYRQTWRQYHRLNDIHEYINYLAVTYPSLCSALNIGHSVEGRPLTVIKISNGNPRNKAIWIDGGIHAREWISPSTVTYIIRELTENFDQQPQAVQNIDWHIIPVANPDGYEYTHTYDRIWRKNRGRNGICFGTDLNRNFGYKWGGRGSSKNPCQETYGGRGPFSEPETAAIQNYLSRTAAGPNWKASLSFHSYGQYVLYPWGYDRVLTPDHRDLQSVGNQIAAAIHAETGSSYTVGSAAQTLYPAAGGSDDWAKGTLGIKYAYTVELRDQGQFGFVLPASYIIPTAKEGFAAVKVVAEAVARL